MASVVAPLDWPPDLVERICGEVSSGRSIRQITQEDWCPSEPSIYRRMASDPLFAQAMTLARAAQQHHEVDACVEMADEATEDDWEVVKLRIWARQWRASKLAPKVYGDRLQQQQLDKDGNPADPVVPAVHVTVARG